MRNTEERKAELHRRIALCQEQRQKGQTALLRTAACALTLSLAALIIRRGGAGGDTMPGIYTGASITYADAGGYVLVAVLAFMVGVIITVLLLRQRARDAEKENRGAAESAAEKEGKT